MNIYIYTYVDINLWDADIASERNEKINEKKSLDVKNCGTR